MQWVGEGWVPIGWAKGPSSLLPPSLIQPMWSSRPAYRRWPWEKRIMFMHVWKAFDHMIILPLSYFLYILFWCRLMNIFLTQFWTEQLLIHKPQHRLTDLAIFYIFWLSWNPKDFTLSRKSYKEILRNNSLNNSIERLTKSVWTFPLLPIPCMLDLPIKVGAVFQISHAGVKGVNLQFQINSSVSVVLVSIVL